MWNRLPRHQCFIYEGAPSKGINRIARVIIGKLNANYRCLYLNSPTMVTGLRCSLAAAGLSLTESIRKGTLILSSDTSHLVNGRFDVDRMIDLLKNTLHQALADGFTGLWASGDMTWEFGNETNFDKLQEYERRLEEFMQQNPALEGICQYHCDTLPNHAIITAMEMHKTVHLNESLINQNPFYQVRG